MKDDNGIIGLALVLVVVICLGLIGLIANEDAHESKKAIELESFNKLEPPVILIGADNRNNKIMLKSKSGILILDNGDLSKMLINSYAIGDTIVKP